MYKFTCAECGSEGVESTCWANPNTDEVTDYCESDDLGLDWCNNCNCFVDLSVEEISDEQKVDN